MNTTKNIFIAIALLVTLASCASKSKEQPLSQEEKYNSIEAVVNQESGLLDDENEVSAKNEKLVTSALEEALRDSNFVYAKKYCALLKNLNYPAFEKYAIRIENAKSDYLRETIRQALRENDYDNAIKYCDELKIVNYSEADRTRVLIRKAGSKYHISQNTEESNNRVLASISTLPEKTKIGSKTESVHMYEVIAKSRNKQLDEYLDLALQYKNDALAQQLLSLYADELTYKSIIKDGNSVNEVTGYRDAKKKDAEKKYQEAKKNW